MNKFSRGLELDDETFEEYRWRTKMEKFEQSLITTRIHVYVASAYTNADPKVVEANVAISMNTCEELWRRGFIPFFTLASHYFEHLHYSHDYEEWMQYDFAWLSKCDAVFRIPGKSSGADREEELATKLGIPIFYDIDTMIKYFKEKEYANS